MDPLGILPEIVEVSSLKQWSEIPPAELGRFRQGEKQHETSPFSFRHDINSKVALWVGDISQLNAQAIVNSTNESLSEHSPVSDRILTRAGPGLREEIQNSVKVCRTGEAKVTKGYNLPARFVIHTVGPKYNLKYQTAAQTALYSCYRRVLQLVCELQLSSVATCVINSVRRGYPPDEGAHIALRTVRRFLEQHGSGVQRVVFAVESLDVGIYELLMPLYFPRSKEEEEYALYHLTKDIGDENGQPVLPERQIRIIHNPHLAHSSDSPAAAAATAAGGGDDCAEAEEDVEDRGESPVSVGSHAFSQMEEDVDRQRLLGERPKGDPLTEVMRQGVEAKERYERLLRRARTEDLSSISGIGCLYRCGTDRMGRPVIVCVGRFFRWREMDLTKALLYVIYLLEPLVKGDYVILYFHTLTGSDNHPPLAWLRDVYNVLDYKYKKNLKAFYVIHPTFWTRVMVWWFTTFMAPQIKKKVHNLSGVEYLYSVIDKNQLEIPAFITEYDMSTNGLHYHRRNLP